MKIADIYSGFTQAVQPVSQPASADRNTAPASAAPMVATHAATIAWIVLVVILVGFRLVYEVAE